MNIRDILLPALSTLLLTAPVMAEESASLPETVEADAVKESAPNLRDELGSPDGDVSVDVRSYQRNDGATITEYAVRGRVYKIKVQPSGGFPAYYLYDRDGDGTFEKRLPGGAKRLSPPLWVLQEF